MDEAQPVAGQPSPQRIASRYDVIAPLGHGGMAVVYRVRDAVSGRELALKQLLASDSPSRQASVVALFEREFHVLAQLAHPSVIEVYDYGIDEGRAYYTMELLEGGDLRDRVPVPWKDACKLFFDVCSSLALLHSRRLVHRDVSPRNVRCTREGRAKLIDFGAMAPMGDGGGMVVGTAAFCAPETLQRAAFDGRADLFSFGATLYYALSGRMAFQARHFADAVEAWAHKPAPLSALVPEIPKALDELVASLISLEPELRPRSAFEVMQRLSAIAELERAEDAGVSRAYLTTPLLVGREAVLAGLRAKLEEALRGRGSVVLIRAAPGLGRSRVLDALALEAKTKGASVLRARIQVAEQPFTTALALAEHALVALDGDSFARRFPDLFEQVKTDATGQQRARLRPLAELAADPERSQRALSEFLLAVSRVHPLLIALDDVERIDEPSAAVLVSVAAKAPRRRILLALTAADNGEASPRALEALARPAALVALEPLSAAETELLFGSIFGEVANLSLVAHEIHAIARGNPQAAIDVAQHLLDQRVIAYQAGTWSLPEQLDARDLPASAEHALRARIATFGEPARFLAQAHALAFMERLVHDDYRALRPELEPHALEAALSELLACHALSTDGSSYTLSNRLWAEALRNSVDEHAARALHRALAEMYRGHPSTAREYHQFAAGLDQEGFESLMQRQAQYAQSFDVDTAIAQNAMAMGPSYARAIAYALESGRPAREVNEMRRWMTALSVISKTDYYFAAAPAWLQQLKLDSGFAAWEADRDNQDAGARLIGALAAAQAHHLGLPEHERVYPVEEAIRLLAQYVALSIAIGSRVQDVALIASLPGLLEPFVALSPILEALWQNALATLESSRDCSFERARVRWLPVYEKLAGMGAELQHADTIRNAIAYGIAIAETALGLPTVATWAERLDAVQQQAVSAMQLRKIARLEQGDWKGAARAQRQAEILALRARAPSMFNALVGSELWAYEQARDLAGLKDVTARIEQYARAYPGWQPMWMLAQARFELVRGNLEQARLGCEQCIAATDRAARDGSGSLQIWTGAQVSLADALLALDRVEEARERARDALELTQARGSDGPADGLVRMLAVAEARLGAFEAAEARLEALRDQEIARGVTGLRLGLCYEAFARVALARNDRAAFEHYAALAAGEYRHAARSPLAARYERLMLDAQRHGWQLESSAARELTASALSPSRTTMSELQGEVAGALLGARDDHELALRALRLLCELRAVRVGHFYRVATDGSLVHVASHAVNEPPPDLAAHVRDYLLREQRSSESETSIATSMAELTVTATSPRVRAGSGDYELLPLTHSRGGGAPIAIIALELRSAPNKKPLRNQTQLLRAIAAHIAAANDSATSSGSSAT